MGEQIDIVKKSLIRKNEDAHVLDYGKLPPQAKQLEEAVLGAIMLEKDVFITIGKILRNEDCFYVDAHQRIYRAMIHLFTANAPIDQLTVVEQLKKNGELDAAGGPYYVAQLTNMVGSAANSEYHARVLKEKYIQRCGISTSTEVIRDCYEDTSDPFEVISKAINNLNNLLDECKKNPDRGMDELVDEFDADLLKEEDVMGYDTGMENLNNRLLGFNKSQLIIIAGRPGEGKTTLMLQGAIASARKGIPVGFISLEMNEMELMQKLYAMEAGIPLRNIRKKKMTAEEWNRYRRAKQFVKTWPLKIYAGGGISIQEARAVITGWNVKYGIEEVFLDYIQLATVDQQQGAHFKNREQEISTITRNLKGIAMELHIPIIAASAMSREIESRQKSERKPILSDLRESGAIEQDANVVIFVFRPEIHGIHKFKDGESTEGITEFIIAKARMDAIGALRATFDGAYSCFRGTDDRYYNNDGDAIEVHPTDSSDSKEKNEETPAKTGDGFDDDLPF